VHGVREVKVSAKSKKNGGKGKKGALATEGNACSGLTAVKMRVRACTWDGGGRARTMGMWNRGMARQGERSTPVRWYDGVRWRCAALALRRQERGEEEREKVWASAAE
jgi:hypothetical protein